MTKVLHLAASHPKLPPKILELHQMYLQRAFEIIEIIPEDKSGLYWKEELQDITYKEVRYLELNKRFKVRETNVSTDAIERVFDFQNQRNLQNYHLKTHSNMPFVYITMHMLAKRVKNNQWIKSFLFPK